MSTITRELAKLFRKITNSEIDAEGNAHVVLSPADSLLINNARIALASLEAEPVAYIFKHPAGRLFWSLTDESNKGQSDVMPVYTAPPAPVALPSGYSDFEEIWSSSTHPLTQDDEMKDFAWDIWNACRAAMLQGAEPVTTAYKLPEGWVAVPIEPTEDMIVNGFESEPDESFSDEKEWEAYNAMSGCQQAAHRAKLCWAAMIAAAPKPEVK